MPLPKDLDELLRKSYPNFIELDDDLFIQLEAFLVSPSRRQTVSFARWQRETREGRDDYYQEMERRDEWQDYLKRLVHYNRRIRTDPTPRRPQGDREQLSERAQCVLVAMLQLGAIDTDNRRTTEEVTAKALGDDADANALKAVMVELKDQKFINTKTGRGGGCWLTVRGCARAKKLGEH